MTGQDLKRVPRTPWCPRNCEPLIVLLLVAQLTFAEETTFGFDNETLADSSDTTAGSVRLEGQQLHELDQSSLQDYDSNEEYIRQWDDWEAWVEIEQLEDFGNVPEESDSPSVIDMETSDEITPIEGDEPTLLPREIERIEDVDSDLDESDPPVVIDVDITGQERPTNGDEPMLLPLEADWIPTER